MGGLADGIRRVSIRGTVGVRGALGSRPFRNVAPSTFPLQSEDVARAALAQLNTKRLFGTELYVRSLAALLPRLKRAESATGADALRASPTNTDSSAPEADGDATGADAARASPSNTDTVVGEDTVALDSDDTDTEAVFEDSWDSLDEVD